MSNNIYEAIKKINVNSMDEDDKEELLKIFTSTNNTLLRNHIAFIFSDLQYNKAVPFILNKIKNPKLKNNNGSLVYALTEMDIKKYFLPFVKIISEQEYEAKVAALDIIKKYSGLISKRTRYSALQNLKKIKLRLSGMRDSEVKKYNKDFINKAIEFLKDYEAG